MSIVSTSCNRILANHANAVREAAITASAQRPSTDVRLIAEARSGGGRVVVAGAYTGAADTTVDVEVLSGTGGALSASTPLINGVGNGVLTVETLRPAAVPETITFSLLHAGDPADPAVLEFVGTTIAARTPGAAGNAITLGVVRDLVATPTQYSTLEPIPAGQAEFDGPAWDWGHPPATDAGIPLAALRIQFEGYPTVHRAWKVWDAGRFLYKLDPAPAWDIPADTRVLAVTGDYTLTLTDGVSPEVYTAVTVHDFLSALASRSALVDVLGVIALDRAPGGMGITDIPLRTDAHALPPVRSVKSTLVRGLVDVTVDPAAPTENITITHAGRGAGGADVWAVRGAVSGDLPSALTGVPYADGPVSFMVPNIVTTPGAVARISAAYNPIARSEGEFVPAICFKPVRLGALATDKTVTFTYRVRPPTDCECAHLPALHLPASCLGFLPEDEMDLDPEYQARLEALYGWRQDFMAGNTDTASVTAFSVVRDMDFADIVTGILAGALAEVYGVSSAAAEWDIALAEVQSELEWLVGIAGRLNDSQFGRVGDVWLNEINGHYYRLAAITKDAVPMDSGGPVSTTAYFEAEPSVSAAWVTDGGDVTLTRLDVVSAEWVFTYSDEGTTAPAGATKANFFIPSLSGQQDLVTREVLENLARRYGARMDYVRTLAGIVPKSDASGTATGDGCWRDYGAPAWWVDESGEYCPMTTNEPYISCRFGCGTDAPEGEPYSTREFGLGVVTECEHRLKDGDRIVITIQGAANVSTYGEGDAFIVPVIAAAPLAFTGGADGDPTQTWTVRGTTAGALPDWLYNPAAPSDYDDAASPVVVSLAPAGIPFETGDSIRLALEGGTMRWRRDAGGWTTVNLFGATHSLGDGLTLSAQAGSAPSFVTGDTWSFQALATYGVSRLRQPRIGRGYAFDTDGAVLDIDLGAVLDIEAVLIALHTLPNTATLAISGGDAAIGEWTAAPTVRPGAILAPLPAGTSARYLRITIAGTVTGASIGWIWAGLGWQPTVGASDLTIARQYGISRGAGLNPAGLYRGRGNGGRWSWQIDQGGALMDSNVDALLELVDYVAAQGLEPVCITPDLREPARASLAILDADEIVMVEHNNWQGSGRAVSVDLPFRAVLA